MGKTFTVPAILSGASFLKDGGMGLHFKTQELTTEEKTVIGDYVNQFGYLLFKENEIKMDEIPTSDAIQDGGKSPSKRLKDRMFVYYKEKNVGDTTEFNKWYERQLEKIGSEYLDRLDT